MPATINYNRPSATLVVSTPLDLTLQYGELPDAPATVAGTGTTAAADLRTRADADPGAGTQIQDLFKTVATPTITADGKVTLTVVVTPLSGSGASLPAQTLAVEHPETADAWQAAAGFPRV